MSSPPAKCLIWKGHLLIVRDIEIQFNSFINNSSRPVDVNTYENKLTTQFPGRRDIIGYDLVNLTCNQLRCSVNKAFAKLHSNIKLK